MCMLLVYVNNKRMEKFCTVIIRMLVCIYKDSIIRVLLFVLFVNFDLLYKILNKNKLTRAKTTCHLY